MERGMRRGGPVGEIRSESLFHNKRIILDKSVCRIFQNFWKNECSGLPRKRR
jgi:hypothetical protein